MDRRSSRAGGGGWVVVLEGLLFLTFVALLLQFYLLPARDPTFDVHWWVWPIVATPFFLGLLVEWRRKKRPILSRERIILGRDE